MTKRLIVWDKRVEGTRPKADEVLGIDEYTPLDWPISWILERAKRYHSDYVWLTLIAHGIQTPQVPLATGFSTTFASSENNSQGGYGIQFGRYGINLQTVVQFKQLYEWLDWTDIRSCAAAYITPGFEGRDGDGNVLCSRLAQVLGSPVRASTATQHYDCKTMEFVAWEGTVLTYGPKGNVIKVENDPKK